MTPLGNGEPIHLRLGCFRPAPTEERLAAYESRFGDVLNDATLQPAGTPGYWSIGNPLRSVSFFENRFHRRKPLFEFDKLPHLDADVHDRPRGAQPNRRGH